MEGLIVRVLTLLGLALGAYLMGSFPTALIVTRWRTGQDVREQGSGHAGATNTMRAAGWAAGLLVAAVDFVKGMVPVALAASLWPQPYAPGLAGGLVVAGHCWPALAGFRGGMGLAPAAGALFAVGPPGVVLAGGLVLAGNLILRHTARANVLTGVLLGPLLWVFALPLQVTAVGLAAGLVVAYRSRIDWGRRYSELWLDRAEEESESTN